MKSQNRIASSNAIRGRALQVSMALFLVGCISVSAGSARAQVTVDAAYTADNDASAAYLSADQLDNLMSPIALYPDPLLAQLLVATTFSDQLDSASQFVSTNNDSDAIDQQPWDTSVKAVAHYPEVLLMVSGQPDWAASVGQAYIVQSTDVMTSIQRLRAQAYAQGNLVTTSQQRVISQGGVIQILPAQPNFLFVPVYNPALVFAQPSAVAFGRALVIHDSLARGVDWRSRRIYDVHHRYVPVPVGRVRPGRVRGPESLHAREHYPQPTRVGNPVRYSHPTTSHCDTPGVAGCGPFAPKSTMKNPSMPVKNPTTFPTSLKNPTTPVKNPTMPVKKPTTTTTSLKNPTTPVKNPTMPVKKPTTTATPVKNQTTAVKNPTTPKTTPTRTPSTPTAPNKSRSTSPNTTTRPNGVRGYLQAPSATHTLAGGATMQAPNLGRGRRR